MNQPDMVALLLKGGTELTLSDRHGDTPVHIAAKLGHVQCLEKMFPTVSRPSCDATRSHGFNSVECRRSSARCDLLNFDGEFRWMTPVVAGTIRDFNEADMVSNVVTEVICSGIRDIFAGD